MLLSADFLEFVFVLWWLDKHWMGCHTLENSHELEFQDQWVQSEFV